MLLSLVGVTRELQIHNQRYYADFTFQNDNGTEYQRAQDTQRAREGTVDGARCAPYACCEAVLWMAILLPAGAPASVVNTLNASLEKAVSGNRDVLLAQGLEPRTTAPQALGAMLRDELTKWTAVARAASLR